MTTPTEPDYTAQHRVIALQVAAQLVSQGHRPPTPAFVLATAETLLAYLNDGTLPPS